MGCTVLGWTPSKNTRKINLPTNQKVYDNFETTVGKLLARRIQIFWLYFLEFIFCLFSKQLLKWCLDKNSPDRSEFSSPRAFQRWSQKCRNPSSSLANYFFVGSYWTSNRAVLLTRPYVNYDNSQVAVRDQVGIHTHGNTPVARSSNLYIAEAKQLDGLIATLLLFVGHRCDPVAMFMGHIGVLVALLSLVGCHLAGCSRQHVHGAFANLTVCQEPLHICQQWLE